MTPALGRPSVRTTPADERQRTWLQCEEECNEMKACTGFAWGDDPGVFSALGRSDVNPSCVFFNQPSESTVRSSDRGTT